MTDYPNQNKNKNKNSDQNSNKNPFAHLAQKSLLIKNSRHLRSLGPLILLGALIFFIFFLIFEKKSHPSLHSNSDMLQNSQAKNKDTILPEDRYLLEQSKQSKQSKQSQQSQADFSQSAFSQTGDSHDSRVLPHSIDSIYASTSSSRALIARQNAPTDMYQSSANALSQDSTQDPTSSNSISGSTGISQIPHPESTIAEGEMLEGSLETAINSDLPGMIQAILTRPVYSYTGLNLLIPAGSRLLGQYTSIASNGAATNRIFVIWNRIITPSGLSLMINSPGADALGQAGISADVVNTHFWKIFGTAALLSVMGVAVSTEGVGSQDQPNSANAYRQSVANSLNSSTEKSLSRNEDIQPTLHIYQGDKIMIFVAHDLDLSGVLG